MDGATFSITLPSEMRMLSVARNFIEAACDAYQLDRQTTNALMIGTGEAITNIVRHAHQNRPDSKIEIQLEIKSDLALITFMDEGDPFDIEAVPQLPPGELRVGGRGVFLMRTVMDELTCEPRGGGCSGNRLRMLKRYAATLREVG